MQDIKDTLAERGARYGCFADHAFICQRIKQAMCTPGWERLADDQKQALETIADKIARILNGDPNYIDNWHDIVGYATLVENRLVGMLPVEESKLSKIARMEMLEREQLEANRGRKA